MNCTQINNNNQTINMVDNKVIINGKEYKKPGIGNTLVQSNNHIFINGYEFKNGKFKRTLRAILECYILF